MALDKPFEIGGNAVPETVTAGLQFASNISRDISGPSFSGIEADNPNWICVLTPQQVRDDSFEIGLLKAGLPPATAQITEIIRHEIDGFIMAIRDSEGVQLLITQLPQRYFALTGLKCRRLGRLFGVAPHYLGRTKSLWRWPVNLTA